MLKLHIDNSAEIFGARVSIADLAQFSFNGLHSDALTVYEAGAILDRDWRWEMVPNTMSLENGLGTSVRFKDGSALSVSAWADCCDGNGYCPQCWEGRTRFNRDSDD